MMKTYSELIQLRTFEERFRYLKLDGKVSEITFGGHRPLNQGFYASKEWKSIRNEIILRDNGCELGDPYYPIAGRIYTHHINPITIEDILEMRDCVFDPENLISCSFDIHNAIHYGDPNLIPKQYVERKPGDTCLWR